MLAKSKMAKCKHMFQQRHFREYAGKMRGALILGGSGGMHSQDNLEKMMHFAAFKTLLSKSSYNPTVNNMSLKSINLFIENKFPSALV